MSESSPHKSCPACGSTSIEVLRESRTVSIPLGPTVNYEALQDHCLVCDQKGDFQHSNAAIIQSALQIAKKACIEHLIDKLVKEDGYSMAHMERALELPQRTMMRWKTGSASDGALALMRMIATYPWLMKVADARYDAAFAQRTLAIEGVRTVANLAEAHNVPQCVVARTDLESGRQTGIFTTGAFLTASENNDRQLLEIHA